MTFDTTRDVVEPLATMYAKEKNRADKLDVLYIEAQARIKALMKERDELRDSLQEILEYDGGADSALEDEYVMDRAGRALAASGV